MARRHFSWTMEARFINCGKARCRSCPHGPYWYGRRKVGGRVETRYFGREYPQVKAAPPPPPPRPGEPARKPPHRHDAIHNSMTATAALAKEIMGILPNAVITLMSLNALYRQLIMVHHPDRGGDRDTMSRINSAYAYLVRMFRGE
jgi:hypothetical protein